MLGLAAFSLGLAVVVGLASRNKVVAAPLLAGFFARAAFVLADEFVLGISRESDGFWWDYHARFMATRSFEQILDTMETGHLLYKFLMSVLYYFVGPSMIMVQMINALFGSVLILVVFRLAQALGNDQRASVRAAWLVALFPSTILHSGLLLREVAVALPLTVGVYHLALWHSKRRTVNAFLAAAFILISMAFHSGSVAVLFSLAIWIAGSWLRALFTGRGRMLGLNTIALLLVGGAVAFIAMTGWGMNKFGHLDTTDMSTLTTAQENFTTGRTAYLDGLHADTPGELLLQAPIRTTYFLFAPFPWMLSDVRDILGVMDSLMFLWLLVRAVRGRQFLRENPTAMLVVVVFLSMTATFSLGVSNYGTAVRHRNKMLPMLIGVSLAIPLTNRKRSASLGILGLRNRPVQALEQASGAVVPDVLGHGAEPAAAQGEAT